MFKDIEEKIKFHKERVIKSFISMGIYPNDDLVKAMLENIDSKAAFLKVTRVKPGDTFDSETFNGMLQSIQRDLILLYELLFQTAIKNYVELQAYADTHLYELKKRVQFYKERSEQEANTTTLGKTILFKNGDFNMRTVNNVTVVDLGVVKLHKASKIACIANANEIEGNKLIFNLSNGTTSQNLAPYNYNQDVFVVPGEVERKEYTYEIDEDQKINGYLKMENVEVNRNNQYVILGGRDKVCVKQLGETIRTEVKNKPTNFNELGFKEKSYIDFYTVGAKSITFTFNKKPLSTNFPLDNYKIDNLDYIHHFFIECEPGFSFSFMQEEGEVYATKSNGVITDNALVYTCAVNVSTFKIVEYIDDNTDSYQLTLEVINDDKYQIDLKQVIVKELLRE